MNHPVARIFQSIFVLSVAFTCVGSLELARAAEKDKPVTELAAASWPAWRGALSQGSTEVGKYPSKLTAETKLWSVELPGVGCSTPIVQGEQILLTAPVDDPASKESDNKKVNDDKKSNKHDAVLSFSWDGKPQWQTPIGPEIAGEHRNGSGSNPSPVTDGRYVFAYFKSGNLAGLDLSGKLLWKINLQEQYGKDKLYWDFGTSPVLINGAVVMAVMHSGESFLAAFNKPDGKLLWKVPRKYKTPNEGDHSYATPIVIEHGGKQAILVWGAERLTAHSAEDGRILWTCEGFNPKAQGNWVVVGSAVVAGDIAVVPYGRGSHLTGVRLGGEGDVTSTHRLWTRNDTGTFVPSPAVYGGKVYLVQDDGKVECLDPKTGETVWTDRFAKNRNKYYSSPTIAAGKLYAAREDGVVMVANIVGGKLELLSENDLGERVIASPAPVKSRLLVRGEQHLFCFGEK